MKQTILFLLFTTFITLTFGQVEPPSYCGTSETNHNWLKHYQANKGQYPDLNDELVASMYLNILSNNNGIDAFSNEETLDALCALSNDLAPAGIKVYLEDGFHYIQNTAWNNHANFDLGADLLFSNNKPNVLNTYIAADAAGNCGYYWMDAVVIAQSCAGVGDHTFSHEVGHFFSLPHPFDGWEGVEYDPNVPTEDYIQAVLKPIEQINDPNCYDAADKFCDTPPDYLSYRWPCNSDNLSLEVMKDFDGNEFRADGSLYMSYSFDECVNRFSPEQIEAMRADLRYNRPEMLLEDVETPVVKDEPIELIYPLDTTLVTAHEVTLEWKPVTGATMYLLQVARFPYLNVRVFDQIVTGTSFTITDLLVDKKYYWRIRPLNESYFCTGFSEPQVFETMFVSNTQQVEALEAVSIYPTVLSTNELLSVNFNSIENLSASSISLTNLAGQKVQTIPIQIHTGTNRFEMPLTNFAPGIYLVRIETEKGQIAQKVVVQ